MVEMGVSFLILRFQLLRTFTSKKNLKCLSRLYFIPFGTVFELKAVLSQKLCFILVSSLKKRDEYATVKI